MPAIHPQAFPPPSPPSVHQVLAGEVLEAGTFRIIKWEIGWLGKRIVEGENL